MRITTCLTAASVCAALSYAAAAQPAATPPAPAAATPAAPAATPATAPAATPVAPAATPAPAPSTFQLNETTWLFTEKNGTKVQESIDSKGNFIAASVAGKHLDHGTTVMKGDKACFTSAMRKEGEVCWTTKPVAVGQSIETTSDKGEKLTVNRVSYVPMTMPK